MNIESLGYEEINNHGCLFSSFIMTILSILLMRTSQYSLLNAAVQFVRISLYIKSITNNAVTTGTMNVTPSQIVPLVGFPTVGGGTVDDVVGDSVSLTRQ